MDSVPGANTVARRPSDRKAVVEYIHASPNLQETDWLEWKTNYDLRGSVGRASTAKHIIGFANRMPDYAARQAEGYAYLILGVEPEEFHGIEVHDSADLENWLRPYVGDRILYDIDYVAAGGVEVLFVTIDPPRWGDDIHSLRRGSQDEHGKTMRRGTVYVRKSGKTDVASDDDIDRLTDRARRQGTSLNLSVEPKDTLVAPDPLIFSDDFRDESLKRHRSALLAALPDQVDPVSGYLRPIGEPRTREQYRQEVDAWVARARQQWTAFALVESVREQPQELTFVVVNETDDNFEAVQVEVTLPISAALVFGTVTGAVNEGRALAPPVPWGRYQEHALSGLDFTIASDRSPMIESVDEERSRVRFSPMHVRPRSRHDVGTIVVAITPDLGGHTLQVEWRLTSTSTRGQLSGTTELVIRRQ